MAHTHKYILISRIKKNKKKAVKLQVCISILIMSGDFPWGP